MADHPSTRGAAVAAEERNPAVVMALSVLTLGIYQLYWWYVTNRQLRDLGRSRSTEDLEVRPWLSTLAFGTGACLVIPLIWTAVTTTRRIQDAEQFAGVGPWLKAWAPIGAFALVAVMCHVPIAAVTVLAVLVRGATVMYLQVALNRVWRGVTGSTAEEREFPASPQPVPVPHG
jgi:Domain of unknown function (DUF4234)